MSNKQETISKEQTASDQITNMAIQDIKNSTDYVFESLVVAGANSKLPEEIFANYFLQYFSGEAASGREAKFQQEWISIAGTPMREVDIIDKTGNVLFAVPALFDTNVIEVSKRSLGESLNDIYKNYDLRNNNIPAVATNYLNAALADRVDEIIKPANVKQVNTVRWENIMKRYGKSLTPGVEKAKEDTNGADDLVYE